MELTLAQRLDVFGAGKLDDRELVALLLDDEAGAALFEEYESIKALQDAPILHLARIVGPEVARQLKLAFEIGRRCEYWRDEEPELRTPEQMFAYFRPFLKGLRQEELHVASLNVQLRVIDHQMVYRGKVDEIGLRFAEVLRPVIIANAPYFALAHNHPSGDVTPSQADIASTIDLAKLARQLDVTMADHIIVGWDSYSSLRQSGNLS